MDTDLSKRQLRSRSIAVSTPRVPTTGQMTTVDTTVPQSITPQVGKSNLHLDLIPQRMKNLTRK